MADQETPVLGYSRSRNRSAALERRRMLVRRAARQYVIMIVGTAVVMCVLALLVTSYMR